MSRNIPKYYDLRRTVSECNARRCRFFLLRSRRGLLKNTRRPPGKNSAQRTVIYAVGRRGVVPAYTVIPPSIFRTYATGRGRMPTVNARSLQRFGVAAFREASTINQRNLLPRFAVGGAIFYAAKNATLPPLLTSRDLTKATMSMNVAFRSFLFFLSFLFVLRPRCMPPSYAQGV